jgi:predicted permease
MTEKYRDKWSSARVDVLRNDVRYGLRQLRRFPAFTVAVVLSLAVGIGLTVAVFTAIDSLVLHPYPYATADRIAFAGLTRKSGPPSALYLTGPQFLALQQLTTLDGAIAVDPFPMTRTGEGLPDVLRTEHLSPNAFAFWGMPPLVGRTFLGSGAGLTGDAAHVVVLSHGYWQRRFNGDRGVIGRHLRLDNEDYDVIGVMSPDFRSNYYDTDIYVPATRLAEPNFAYGISVRVKPEDTFGSAAARIQSLLELFARENPKSFPPDFRVQLTGINESQRAQFAGTLNLLLAASALLLFVGCANVAILFLAHATGRRREIEVRHACGASPARIVMQLLTEATCIATAGVVAGVFLARASVALIVGWSPATFFPPDVEIRPHAAAVGFTVAVAAGSTLLFGLWPAIRAARAAGQTLVGISGHRTTDAAANRRSYSLLIIAQVAITTIILAGAGAALHRVVELMSKPLGYEPSHVLRVTITAPDGQYTTWSERLAYYERIRGRVAQLPQVASVAIDTSNDPLPPIARGRRRIEIAGSETGPDHVVLHHRVSAEYFSSLGIPLRQGRLWSVAENATVAHVAVVNDAMARQYWPSGNAIGQRVRIPDLTSNNTWNLPGPHSTDWLDVIGIVGNVPNAGLADRPLPALFIPSTLFVPDRAFMVVRTTVATDLMNDTIRRAINEAVPGVPAEIKSATDLLKDVGWGLERFIAGLFTLLAAMALVIGSVGLYSVMSYVVTHRTKELGIRAALGARASQLTQPVLTSALVTVVIGLIAGVSGSVAINRVLKNLSGISASDSWLLAIVAVVLISVAFLAALLPARRASRVDPMVALRCE